MLVFLPSSRPLLMSNHLDAGGKPGIQAHLLDDKREVFESVSNNKYLEINRSLYDVALSYISS